MRRKSDAVVFIGMVYPWGIIRHFALLGIELAKACGDFDYYFASISRAPDKGAWELIRRAIPSSAIIETMTFAELVNACEKLFANHNRVLIHCGGGWGQTKAIIPLRKKFGKRLILIGTTHSYHIDSAMRIPMSAFQSLLYLRYYDKIVFQCQYAADQFWGARMLFAAKKGIVIPLGCEPFEDVLPEPPTGIAANDRLLPVLQNAGLFKFVYLAGFRPGKKHVWLVHAIAPVLKRYPQARVLFCGTGDPAVIEATAAAIREEKLEQQILIVGQVARQEVPWLLTHSNCAVVPSRAETFGHNFLEPMFAGLPVLGTRVGIGRDIIKDGETGMGFLLCNSQSLQNAADYILSNPDGTRRMGAAAKKLVEHRFRHSDVAQQLNQLYCGLLEGA